MYVVGIDPDLDMFQLKIKARVDARFVRHGQTLYVCVGD